MFKPELFLAFPCGLNGMTIHVFVSFTQSIKQGWMIDISSVLVQEGTAKHTMCELECLPSCQLQGRTLCHYRSWGLRLNVNHMTLPRSRIPCATICLIAPLPRNQIPSIPILWLAPQKKLFSFSREMHFGTYH